MPFVSVKTLKGLFNEIQKQELMDGIADLVVNVAGGDQDRFQQAVWVVIEEEEPGNWHLANSPELQASRQKRVNVTS